MKRRLALLVLTLALAIAGCGGDDDKGKSGKSGASGSASSTTAPGGCEDVKAPAPRPDGGAHRPVRPLAAGKTYDVTLQTTADR